MKTKILVYLGVYTKIKLQNVFWQFKFWEQQSFLIKKLLFSYELIQTLVICNCLFYYTWFENRISVWLPQSIGVRLLMRNRALIKGISF